MKATFPRLLGDVGGTNARWAWQAAAGAPIAHYAGYRCAQFESVLAVIERYRLDHALPPPAAAAFGIATAITGDRVQMTNHPWSFSIAELRAALGVDRCLVLNDFEAIAWALTALGPGDTRRVGGGAADGSDPGGGFGGGGPGGSGPGGTGPERNGVAGAPLAVLGPGTGLGVAGLVRSAGGAGRVIVGEGGHVTLAAATAREAEVVAWLQQTFGHASAERAISGPGLVNLRDALCAIDTKPAAPPMQPAEVAAAALSGADPVSAEALQLFGAFLGGVAGNLALTLGAHGGVYLGGGIVPSLGAAFDALPFRERFEAKGRFRGYLARIPTWVITAPAPALCGAAAALDAAERGAAG